MKRLQGPVAALAVALLATTGSVVRPTSAQVSDEMAPAATRFLGVLSPDQRGRAVFPFASDERTRWHFIPNEMFPRRGVSLGELDADQKPFAQALVRSGLSQRGFLTVTAIMELERILRSLEQDGRFARDPGAYFISLFGTPDAKGTWGWRVEGHHLSLHFTIIAGATTVSTPSFLGANPAEVREGPLKGHRALGPAEDAGRALLLALDPSQRAEAVFNDVAPQDIVTGTRFPIDPLSPVGIAASALSSSQQTLLENLINAYTSVMADDIAALRWSRIRQAGLEKITFAWAGAPERGPHYYRVQGPTFLIEYDNTQNDANHIHSIWRDFTGDFGRDPLREHLREVRHEARVSPELMGVTTPLLRFRRDGSPDG